MTFNSSVLFGVRSVGLMQDELLNIQLRTVVIWFCFDDFFIRMLVDLLSTKLLYLVLCLYVYLSFLVIC